jgi:hypothetical protein
VCDSPFTQALDKLCDKSIVVFDALLASYQLLADTVRAQPPEKEIEFLLIDCTQVRGPTETRKGTVTRVQLARS